MCGRDDPANRWGCLAHLTVSVYGVGVSIVARKPLAQMPRFGAVVEAVETLSLEDQEMLVDLVRHRLIEQRRAEIGANIARTCAEYHQGQVRRGTVDDLLAELPD